MKNQSGQTLIEVLIALGISMLVIGSIIVVITTALSNAQFTKNKTLASNYAQEGMDVVRQIRDSSITDFKNLASGRHCLNTDLEFATLAGSSCSPNIGIFTREVEMDHDIATSDCNGGSRATVTVSWPDSKCPSGGSLCEVELTSCFAIN